MSTHTSHNEITYNTSSWILIYMYYALISVCMYTNQVLDTESKLTKWANRVTELRSQHQWLLFFSVPKQLLLFQLIQEWDEENVEECLDLLLKEVMFLVTNDPIARKDLRENIQVRNKFQRR